MFSAVLFALGGDIGPLRAFADSDAVGRLIVIVQIAMSVASWAVMSGRTMWLRDSKLKTSRFADRFAAKDDALALFYEGEKFGETGVETIYQAACARLVRLIPADVRERLRLVPSTEFTLSDKRMALVETTCYHVTDEVVLRNSKGMTALAIMTSSAPLLGLFGTVWGVMLAFQSMAASGSANIAELAPGISSALLTTVVGLIVAIPSTIFYNVLQKNVEAADIAAEGFADELMGKLNFRYRRENI